MTTALNAAMRLQFKLLLKNPGDLVDFAIAPLLAFIFFAILASADREDLFAYALFAPVMITLWSRAVYSAGEIIGEDRWNGILEPLIATGAPFALLLLGRVTAITALGFISLIEAWLVATIFFGAEFHVWHVDVLVINLVASGFASASTGVLVAGLFLRMREPRTFQNSITYPFYVLGGVLVPVSYLPDWLAPLSNLIFLSWSTDLLRDTVQPDAVEAAAARIAAILVLGTTAMVLGLWIIGSRLRALRHDGSIGHA